MIYSLPTLGGVQIQWGSPQEEAGLLQKEVVQKTIYKRKGSVNGVAAGPKNSWCWCV